MPKQGARRIIRLSVLQLCFVAAIGCGPAKMPAPDLTCHPVHGKVIGADGQPFKSGEVLLTTKDNSYMVKGKIGPDGTFTLTTHFSNPPKETPGAPAEGYMARVMADQESPALKLERKSVSIKPGENELVLKVVE